MNHAKRILNTLAGMAAILSLACGAPATVLRSIQSERQASPFPAFGTPTRTSGSWTPITPTPTTLPLPTLSFDQLSDQDLLVGLACTAPGTGQVECVGSTTQHPKAVGLIYMVSTGRVTHLPLIASDGTTPIGEIAALETITRDASSEPAQIYLLLQAEQASLPGVNSFPWTYEMVYLIDLEAITEVPGSSDLRSDETWSQLMPRGSQWKFTVASLPYSNENMLEGSLFHSAGYEASLTCFIQTAGSDCAQGLIVVPVGITGIPRYP